MVELGTGLTLLGTAVGSAKLVEKLLGPTAEYLGGGIKDLTEKGVRNLGRIFSDATQKAQAKLNTEGAVPPKVLKGILQEGMFCDDSLSAEYFGGVLASSRTGVARDDRGASFIALIGRLSTYQIRSHYIFYHIIKSLFNGRELAPTTPLHRDLMRVYVPFSVFVPAMDFSKEENIESIATHIIYGLPRERLIDDKYTLGGVESIRNEFENSREAFGMDSKERQAYSEAFTEGGFVFQPTPLGVELFLWAYGKAELPIEDFLKPENEFSVTTDITIPAGAKEVQPITSNTFKSVTRRSK